MDLWVETRNLEGSAAKAGKKVMAEKSRVKEKDRLGVWEGFAADSNGPIGAFGSVRYLSPRGG